VQDLYPSKEDIARAEVGDLVLSQGTLGDREADFGALIVPESRHGAYGRRIELPVVRIHAQGPKPSEPVSLFKGGPGLTNIKPDHVPDWLLEAHDVVMVGYRGIDGSVSLQSPELNAALKSPTDPLSVAGLQQAGQSLTQTAGRLRREGIDLGAYSVLNVVDDVEDARVALGHERVHLSGGSYGGAVAYAYFVRYPERVARAILSEAAFPFNVGLTEPGQVDSKLLRLNELWHHSPRVSDSADIVATMRRVLRTLPREWKGIPIIPGKVRLTTYLGMYTADMIAQTFDAFVAAEEGDYGGLAFMSLMWDQVVGWFNWGDLCAKTYSTKVGSERDYASEMDASGSIIGSPLSKLAWASLQYSGWQPSPLPERHQVPQVVDAETLLIYGSREAVPQQMLPFFPRGSLVALEDPGHMEVTATQPEAAAHLQRRFLLDGVADTSKYEMVPQAARSFVPSVSYQEQARQLLANLQEGGPQ